jgi:DNA-binding transcriptional LysR family regulator
MEMRHLRYFIAVAEEENVTRAAERLRISQPPLSRQIRDLEEEIGVSLLERTAKTVRLSPAGRAFLEEARAVIQRVETAVGVARAIDGGTRGELNIGYSPTLTVELLPEGLRWFQGVSPEVKVVIHDLNTEEMFQGLNDGRLQLALMPTPRGRRLRNLHVEKLRSYDIAVAMPSGHRLAVRTSLKFEDIRDERLIGYSRTGYPEYHEDLARRFGCPGKNATRASPIQEEHDSVSSLVAAVESGRGVALVATCLKAVVGARLELRPLMPECTALSVGAVWSGEGPSTLVARFLEGLRKAAAKSVTPV